MTSATRTCGACGSLVAFSVHGGRCPGCHRLVTGQRQNRDLLAAALPQTRETAALRAAIRAHRRLQRKAAA